MWASLENDLFRPPWFFCFTSSLMIFVFTNFLMIFSLLKLGWNGCNWCDRTFKINFDMWWRSIVIIGIAICTHKITLSSFCCNFCLFPTQALVLFWITHPTTYLVGCIIQKRLQIFMLRQSFCTNNYQLPNISNIVIYEGYLW